MTYDIDHKLIRSVADADVFYGSAVQLAAQELEGLIAHRSWCDDEGQAACLSEYIEREYLAFLALLPRS